MRGDVSAARPALSIDSYRVVVKVNRSQLVDGEGGGEDKNITGGKTADKGRRERDARSEKRSEGREGGQQTESRTDRRREERKHFSSC